MNDNMRVGFTIKEMNDRLQQAFDEGKEAGERKVLNNLLFYVKKELKELEL